MLIFKRDLEDKIVKNLFKGMILTILGPRQSGKITLCKTILHKHSALDAYFDCQISEVRDCLVPGKPELLKKLIDNKKMVVLDEAQTVQDIGIVLKVFHDIYPKIQIMASGSSSCE